MNKKGQVGVGNLQAIIMSLVMVGLIVGIGVLVLDKFGDAAQGTTSVVDENVTVTAQSGTTAFTDDTSNLVGCYDATNKTALVPGTSCILGTNGEITTLAAQGTPINVQVNYSYEYDTETTTRVNSARNAVGTVGTDWMSLIVTIVILSLLLGLVLAGFGGQLGGR